MFFNQDRTVLKTAYQQVGMTSVNLTN